MNVETNLTPVEAMALVAKATFAPLTRNERFAYLDAAEDAVIAYVAPYTLLISDGDLEICHEEDGGGGQSFTLRAGV